ncbi:M949_RS01915 family surface polysaccharide biosynthesis protein [Massilia frigida]
MCPPGRKAQTQQGTIKRSPASQSWFLALCLSLAGAAAPQAVHAAAGAVQTFPVAPGFLASEHLPSRGTLVKAKRIVDRAGEHLLVVTLRSGPSTAANATPGAVERFELYAVLYTHKDKDKAWTQTWIIQDHVDCPGLDSGAEFFPEYITVTDLDKNSLAEVTVPYKMSCGGGVDASELKIILRQGEQKLALRGTTLRNTNVSAPYGGEMRFDQALSLKENAVFKAHLKFVRDKVYVED